MVWARTASSVVRPLAAIALGDRALADAVAAADLHVVRQGRHGGYGTCPHGRAPIGLAEDISAIAIGGDVRAFAHQVEIPGAVGDIAVEHRADRARPSRSTSRL